MERILAAVSLVEPGKSGAAGTAKRGLVLLGRVDWRGVAQGRV